MNMSLFWICLYSDEIKWLLIIYADMTCSVHWLVRYKTMLVSAGLPAHFELWLGEYKVEGHLGSGGLQVVDMHYCWVQSATKEGIQHTKRTLFLGSHV